MGVIAIAVTFASLIAMPFLSTTHIGSPKFRVLSERMYFGFVAVLALLTWVGAAEIMDATIFLGQVCTSLLFVYLVLIYPFLPLVESHLYLYGTSLLYDGNGTNKDTPSSVVAMGLNSISLAKRNGGPLFGRTTSMPNTSFSMLDARTFASVVIKRGKCVPSLDITIDPTLSTRDQFMHALNRECNMSLKQFNSFLSSQAHLSGPEVASELNRFNKSLNAQYRSKLSSYDIKAVEIQAIQNNTNSKPNNV